MSGRALRIVGLLAATGVLFGVVVLIGLRLLPQPHTETDYLVVGTIATLVAIALLFAILITTWVRSADVFFKRRPGPPED
jgi:hypothetical protein